MQECKVLIKWTYTSLPPCNYIFLSRRYSSVLISNHFLCPGSPNYAFSSLNYIIFLAAILRICLAYRPIQLCPRVSYAIAYSIIINQSLFSLWLHPKASKSFFVFCGLITLYPFELWSSRFWLNGITRTFSMKLYVFARSLFFLLRLLLRMDFVLSVDYQLHFVNEWL